jgi:hypothetical protein
MNIDNFYDMGTDYKILEMRSKTEELGGMVNI